MTARFNSPCLATITRHGVTLKPVWFDRATYSAQLGFCTDPGVRELRALFVADGAHVPYVDGYAVAFVQVAAWGR